VRGDGLFFTAPTKAFFGRPPLPPSVDPRSRVQGAAPTASSRQGPLPKIKLQERRPTLASFPYPTSWGQACAFSPFPGRHRDGFR